MSTTTTNTPTPNNDALTNESKSKVVTDDDIYRHSSQYKNWSFNREKLNQKRLDKNGQASNVINSKLINFRDRNSNSLTPNEIKLIMEQAIPVTSDEEIKLVNFYAKKVLVIAQHLNLPTEVIATSIIFFKRFYLENSVMEIDPKTIVHTTIFLACKSENYFISVDSFAKKAKSNKDTILNNEFKILESIKFNLLNHHPYKPLHGFFLDIQSVLQNKVDINYMGQIYDKCKKRITDALLTDVTFYFTPPQITLAVLLIEDEALIMKYLETKFPSIEPIKQEEENVEEVKDKETKEDEKNIDKPKITLYYENILNIIQECSEQIKNPVNISVQEAKSIAAKIYYCQNPMNVLNRLKRKEEQSQTPTQDQPDIKKQKPSS